MITWDLIEKAVHDVSCFVDGSGEKQKGLCCGLKVIPPDSFNSGVLFITNQTYAKPMEKSCAPYLTGGTIITLKAYFTAKNITKFEYLRNNIFFDTESVNVLDTMVYENLTSKNKFWTDIYNKNQYFCLDELMGAANEVFVDIGAAVGDTIERFIWEKNGYISRIYAFEPSPHEYSALKYRMKRLTREWMFNSNQINIINAGIAEKTGTRILKQAFFADCPSAEFRQKYWYQ